MTRVDRAWFHRWKLKCDEQFFERETLPRVSEGTRLSPCPPVLTLLSISTCWRRYIEAMNQTEAEIKERVLAAVNVRFTVAVLLVIRKQISVNGRELHSSNIRLNLSIFLGCVS